MTVDPLWSRRGLKRRDSQCRREGKRISYTTSGKMISDNVVLSGNIKVDVMREEGVNCREKPVVTGKCRKSVEHGYRVEIIRIDCQAATAGKPTGSMYCRQDNKSFSEENGTRMTMWRDWRSKP